MNTQIIEINEAEVAGKEVLNQIDMIEDKLHRAKTWGFIDLLSDSGFLTAILKHDNLHTAQELLDDLKSKIAKFNNELNDIKVDTQLNNVTMSSGIEIADWLIDGLIIDAITLSKISESQRQMEDIKNKVQNILNDLKKIKNKL